jgi:hypothetical protein
MATWANLGGEGFENSVPVWSSWTRRCGIDYLGGTTNEHTLWLDRELKRQRLGLTDLILCEVLQGIRDDAVFAQVRRALSSFRVFNAGGAELALAAA